MEAIERVRARMPEAAKDIQLNLSSVLQPGVLDPTQRWTVAAACAFASDDASLASAIVDAAAHEAGPEAIDDARAAAVLMAMNNVYYRFRHVIGKPAYSDKPPRLRMNRMAQPKTDRATFELACLAVSAINGCETCVKSHEAAVLERGLTEDHVHEAVRIAATVRAASVALGI
jgi:alkyl hydroperoxide reductase subunit D